MDRVEVITRVERRRKWTDAEKATVAVGRGSTGWPGTWSTMAFRSSSAGDSGHSRVGTAPTRPSIAAMHRHCGKLVLGLKHQL